MFKWTDSLITGKDRENLEDTVVEFIDIFAQHRLDIGMNTQFKVSPTSKDDKPVYTQSLPVLINLKEDLAVELDLMHRYGIITTLPFSKHASPIFAQRKPNGKLTTTTLSAPSQMRHNTLRGKNCSANSTAPRHTTASKSQTKGQ